MSKLWVGWCIFILWVTGTSWLLFQTGNAYYGEFDPKRQLQQQLQQLPQLNRLIEPQNGAATLLHVLDENCPCTQQARAHIQSLQGRFAQQALQQPLLQLYLSAAELRAAGVTVPATPMVIYLKDQQLHYSGPYASGPACSSSEDLLAAIVQNKMQTPDSWLNSETLSCRCLSQNTG